MTERLNRARDLGRQLDAAEAERAKITAEIDGRIRRLTAEYAALFGEVGDRSTADKPQDEAEVPTNGDGKTQGDKVVALLRTNPGATNPTLVLQLYGEDTRPNRNRLRSLLHFLKGKKMVKRVPGKQARWEVA